MQQRQCTRCGKLVPLLTPGLPKQEQEQEHVNHPAHYGGGENPYEAIKVMQAWYGKEAVVQFCVLTAAKYLSRAGKKPNEPRVRDLEKARWYLSYAIGLETETDDGAT